jgi:hypothetical protein
MNSYHFFGFLMFFFGKLNISNLYKMKLSQKSHRKKDSSGMAPNGQNLGEDRAKWH